MSSVESLATDPLSHQGSARGSWLMYVLAAIGILFMVAPRMIDPQVHCREYPCPFWLRGLIFALGLVFVGGALLAILRGLVWGSRIDAETQQLIWWYGAPPPKQQHIAISRITRIRVEEGDSVHLKLFDANGKLIYMPRECVPSPKEWAAAMGRRFPSIKIELPDKS